MGNENIKTKDTVLTDRTRIDCLKVIATILIVMFHTTRVFNYLSEQQISEGGGKICSDIVIFACRLRSSRFLSDFRFSAVSQADELQGKYSEENKNTFDSVFFLDAAMDCRFRERTSDRMDRMGLA